MKINFFCLRFVLRDAILLHWYKIKSNIIFNYLIYLYIYTCVCVCIYRIHDSICPCFIIIETFINILVFNKTIKIYMSVSYSYKHWIIWLLKNFFIIPIKPFYSMIRRNYAKNTKFKYTGRWYRVQRKYVTSSTLIIIFILV
jgi:hypothetical protein